MSWDKERIAPVSYTHLDVYKRQGSRRYSFPIRQTMIRTLGFSWKGAVYTPVSYTHLDVYKRQVYTQERDL